MASRWGAGGDETLTISTMDLFSSNTLDEDDELSPGETLEVFQSTLDPSILSMFEDTHTGEEESEATLLTALTEILDNVDDENLSPFDILPDSDLLSGQKAREHSPLRRLLCLSRSPPEKDPFCNMRPFSTGKSLSRSQAASVQRSDGEEDDYGSLTPSSPDQELPDWGNRTLPSITLEQEGEDYDGISVSLGDLVKHMHPYCMTICVEDGLEEQMLLPEGGILLEVVDQGEHGEPILAIQDMDLSLPGPVPQNAPEMRQRVPDEEDDAASDISEHIIVDDDDYDDDTMANEALAEFARHLAPLASSEVKDDAVIKRPKEEIREKSPSRRRRKKKKSKKGLKQEPVEEEDVPPVEGRVLRSSSSRRAAEVSPRKTAKKTIKEEKKRKESTAPCASSPPSSLPKPRGRNGAPAETQSEVTTLTLPTKSTIKKGAEPLPPTTDQSPGNASPETSPVDSPPTPINSSQSEEMAKLSAPAADKLPVSSAVTAAVSPVPLSTTPLSPPEDSMTQLNVLPQNPLPSSESSTPPPVTAKTSDLAPPPPAPEAKPKSLSLAEYRRLRLEKKLVPVEKTEDHSTKWPSLPEPPKELPPIPCLPDPSPRDARRPHHPPPSKEADEVKTAWQPMGPGAPPTPEALLVPPAYMVAASRKVASAAAASAPKPQPAPQDSQPRPASAPTTSLSPLHATLPAAKPLVPHNSGSPPPVLRSVSELTPTAEKLKSFSAPSKVEGVAGERPCPPQVVLAKPVLVNEGLSKTTTNSPKPTAASVFAQILKTTAIIRNVPLPIAANPPASDSVVTPASRPSSRPAVPGPHTAPFRANQPSRSSAILKETNAVALGVEGRPTAEPGALRAKSRTQELIEAFTSEIGIEAADLTSLLEQFEETQAKVEQIVPEVSGRAAAVGNSSGALTAERSAVERVRANDLSSIAALTPPATPPHQMWKPLAPVALLAKSRAATEGPPKPSPSKVIQIDARPLPAAKLRSKPTAPAPAVSPELISMDHDYCLPSKVAPAGEQGQRWNIKQQPFITIKTIKRPPTTTTTTQPSQMVHHRVETTAPVLDTKSSDSSQTDPLDHRTVTAAGSSVLETPDASPVRRETDDDDDAALTEESPRHGRSYRRHASDSRSPSPRPASKDRKRGRSSRRGSRSPSPTSSSGSDSDGSSSSSQSRSRSPPRKRYRRRSASRSSSSSRSSSRSVSRSPPRRRRYSYSSSRSGSWSRSRSRSRSRSPWMEDGWSRGRRTSRSGYRPSVRESSEEVKRRKEKAIEERRVVYVGRIRGTMTRKELRERFSLYGEIEECTLHFRDHGDNYGFVTYYDTKDAFTAIENGGKLRRPDELPFDLCFGGRRQFCQTSYADLDSNRDSYDPSPSKANFNALDFDTLLKQAQKSLKR